MEKKRNIKLLVIGLIALLVLSFGASYAYFVSRINQEGEGSNVGGSTATKEDTVVTTNGSIGFEDTNIYPGHKNISKVVVTATGDSHVIYNLVWTGTNTLNTTLKYSVYKTTSEESPTITCTKKEIGTIRKELYEECEENLTNLGEVIKTGEIKSSGSNTKVKLVKNEEIDASNTGAKSYYYIVLEYPNKEETQNIDMNGLFTGNINVELLDKKEMTKDTILANKTVEERTDFSTTLEENTTGKIFKSEDNDGDTYYYAGSVDNNWVKFGTENGKDLYWRIVRINGDGTIRLIYSGTSTTTYETVLDEKINNGEFTPFNSESSDNAYVGYMYGSRGSKYYSSTHRNSISSYAKTQVDDWYKTYLNKEEYTRYIDTNAGFCGDREAFSGTGTGGANNYDIDTYTEYNAYNRLTNSSSPSLKCVNDSDLYTVSSSNKGNRALTYPVGLISADEVIYAGAKFDERASGINYYLNVDRPFFTMTSALFDYSNAYIYTVFIGNVSMYLVSNDGNYRPVINLKADVEFTGDGSVNNPYEVS